MVNLHHAPHSITRVFDSLFQEFLSDQSRFLRNYRLFFSDETLNLLGSGGAVWKAQDFLFPQKEAKKHNSVSSHVVVANGDSFILFHHSQGLKPLLKAHEENGALMTFLTTCFPKEKTSQNKLWVQDGVVKTFGSKPPNISYKGQHFVGVYVISEHLLPFFPEGMSHIFWDVLVPVLKQNKKVMTYCDPHIFWLETNTVDEFERSQKKCFQLLDQDGVYSVNLKKILKYFGK